MEQGGDNQVTGIVCNVVLEGHCLMYIKHSICRKAKNATLHATPEAIL